jgi:hypothetical protein
VKGLPRSTVAGSLALVGALVLAGRVLGAEPGEGPPVVVTTGAATVRAAPDRAFVTLSVESRAKDPKVAQQQNATAMNAVVGALHQAGLSGDALRTLAFDLHPEFDYVSGKQVLRGYVARNTLEARVEPIARLGEVIDLAVSSGSNTLSGVRFDLTNRDEVERQALRQAVADARARADAAAAGAGVSIDRVLRVEESRMLEQPPRPMPLAMRATADAEAASTPIEAGEIEVRAHVTLTAAIK